MSTRLHEILNLKVKDIQFKISHEGIYYTEVKITQRKTGPRTVPLMLCCMILIINDFTIYFG